MRRISEEALLDALEAIIADWKAAAIDEADRISLIGPIVIVQSTVREALKRTPTLHECSWPEGVEVRLDGVHETEAHEWEEAETIEGCTVQILRCKRCGAESVGWRRPRD